MLNATQKLLDLYAEDRRHGKPEAWSVRYVREGYARAIARHGSAGDATVLLNAYLEAPDGRRELVRPLKAVGDERIARTLFSAFLDEGRSHPHPDEEGATSLDWALGDVLEMLGYLGLAEAEPTLWHYASASTIPIYPANDGACRGLIDLPCTGLGAEIEAAIRRWFGSPLFPEYLPALAHKTGSVALLRDLFEQGRDVASSSCNHGIILGVGLCGDAGRPYFDRFLLESEWEAWVNDGSAGSPRARELYRGSRALGLRIADLFAQLKRAVAEGRDREQLATNLLCVTALAEEHLDDPDCGIRSITDPGDDLVALYDALFDRGLSGDAVTLSDLWYQLYNSEEIVRIASGPGVADSPGCPDRTDTLEQRMIREIAHRIEVEALVQGAS